MFRCALTALLCASMATAQELDVLEGFRPFRTPIDDPQVPRDLYDDLQVLVNLIESPGEHEITIDDEGREVCSDPVWQRKREEIAGKLFNMATVFGIVLRDSKHVNDRKLSVYGTFLLDDPKQVCELIAFLPGEPVRAIREDGFRRAIHFLRVHLPQSVAVLESGDYIGVPPSIYRIDAGPFLTMLELDDYRDLTQALWFLRELMLIQPEVGKTFLHFSKEHLPRFLTSEHDIVREHARAFLLQADPDHRDPPPADAENADELALAWMDEVLYQVFPPIRPVSAGLTDLYPSDDLERVIEVGRKVLAGSSIGETYEGTTKNGLYYRGYRVARVPKPLDKLRIPVDSVITSIQGHSVATAADILSTLETWFEKRRSIIVEYVYGGTTRVMEYRLQDP